MSSSLSTVKTSPTFKAKLAPNGRIVIPAGIREEMGLKPGESLLMEVEDGVLRIESYRSRIRRIQAEFAHLAKPGVLASEELIAERREEARLELLDFELARELRRERHQQELKDGKVG
jgi:AbrB family looped-hinge helix DNA binding protein